VCPVFCALYPSSANVIVLSRISETNSRTPHAKTAFARHTPSSAHCRNLGARHESDSVSATTIVTINFWPLALRASTAKMVTSSSNRTWISQGGGLFRDLCRQFGVGVRLLAMTRRGRTRTRRHVGRCLRPRAPSLWHR
jgi:hypothetical protein